MRRGKVKDLVDLMRENRMEDLAMDQEPCTLCGAEDDFSHEYGCANAIISASDDVEWEDDEDVLPGALSPVEQAGLAVVEAEYELETDVLEDSPPAEKVKP